MTTKPRKGPAEPADLAVLPGLGAPDAAAQVQLRDTLNSQKLPQLRAMATAHGLVARGSGREALIDMLRDHLLDQDAQATLIAGLGPTARAILALAVILDWSRNHFSAKEVHRVLSHERAATIEQALSQLGEFGLVLPPPAVNARYDPALHVPAALLTGLLPLLPTVHGYTGDLPPAGTETGDDARLLAAVPALQKIGALLTAFAAGEYQVAVPGPRDYRGQPTRLLGRWEVVGDLPAPTARGRADERPLGIQVATGAPLLAGDGPARLQAAAGLSGAEEVNFFVQVLAGLGLLLQNGTALAVHPVGAETFSALPPAARLRRVLDVVLGVNQWSELDLLLEADPALGLFRNSTLHYAEPAHMRGEVSHVRQAVVLLLAWLPVGAWYDVNALLATLHRLFPELPVSLQPRTTGWEQLTWWLERADGNKGWQYLDRRAAVDWMRGLGRLVTSILGGPLTWLGLVETTTMAGARLTGDRPLAAAGFRLTAPGGTLLGRRPAAVRSVQPPAAGAAAARARNPAQLLAPAQSPEVDLAFDPRGLPLDELIRLGQLAMPIRIDPDLCLYRLTPASVRRGFDSGLDGAELENFLRRLTGSDLPAGARARVRDWWEAYGRLRFYTGVTVLTFSDDFTLAELLASTSLGSYLLYQFSPRLVVVPTTAVDKLLAELGRSGYTPRVIDESLPAPVSAGGGL